MPNLRPIIDEIMQNQQNISYLKSIIEKAM